MAVFNNIIMTSEDSEESYTSITNMIKSGPITGRSTSYSGVSWGQRKLMLTEIQFLSLYVKEFTPETRIIYIGAAPGIHIPLLLSLFPKVKFVLYDPSDFDKKVHEAKGNRLEIHQELFTDEEAQKYTPANLKKGESIYLLSDVRTRHDIISEGKDINIEIIVKENMEMQARWVEIIKPEASHLKFRLPFSGLMGPRFPYFKGTVYYQPWAPYKSTETRLVVLKADIGVKTEWNVVVYENKMNYINLLKRGVNLYLNRWGGGIVNYYEDELVSDWDSNLEVEILLTYLKSLADTSLASKANVIKLSKLVTKVIAGKRNMNISIKRTTVK